MMLRLLRGQLLYLVLAAFVAVLYARALTTQRAQPVDPKAFEQIEQVEMTWPRTPDPKVVRQVTQQHPALGAAAVGLTVLIAGLGIGGVGLTLWGLWTGRVRSVWRFPEAGPPAWSLGELGRIVVLTVLVALMMPFVRLGLLALKPSWGLDVNLWVTVSMLCLDLFVILIALTFTMTQGRPVPARLGFSSVPAASAIRDGLVGYAAVFPWLFVLLLAVVQVARWAGIDPQLEPIHHLVFYERRPLVLGLTMVLACAVGPIAEECFFRGVLYGALRARLSRLIAMLASGALFALIHTNLVGFVPILALACLLAYVYERTGSLAASIAVHMAHNTLLLSFAMIVRQLGMLTG